MDHAEQLMRLGIAPLGRAQGTAVRVYLRRDSQWFLGRFEFQDPRDDPPPATGDCGLLFPHIVV